MKKIFSLLILTAVIISCDKYLDIEPKNSVIPRSVEEYDLLLNSVHTIENEDVLALTADDYQIESYYASANVDNHDNQHFQLFSWGKYRFYNPQTPVNAWNSPYKNIYTCNKVINEVIQSASSLGYTDKDKLKIQAEAYYNRALDYFYLVNVFAKPYSPSANTDLSVPIVTIADVTQPQLPRASVAQVYDFIINDLEKAIQNLPTRAKLHTRANLGAGYSLLSRVFLYKGDYQKSLEYANKAIAISNVALVDYVNYNKDMIHKAYQSEQYSIRYFGGTAGYQGALSDNFKKVLDTQQDARYYQFYEFYPGYGEYKSTYEITPNAGASVGEMYVTRAECYARLGQKALAIADLNTLRSKRITNHILLQVTDFATDKDLVKFCLEERRRETFQTHLRLFDIKRMNLEPEYASTITKAFLGKTYTAEPNSGKLVLPIPEQVLKFNPSWK